MQLESLLNEARKERDKFKRAHKVAADFCNDKLIPRAVTAEAERDAWKERYDLLHVEARKVNRAWKLASDERDEARRVIAGVRSKTALDVVAEKMEAEDRARKAEAERDRLAGLLEELLGRETISKKGRADAADALAPGGRPAATSRLRPPMRSNGRRDAST